MVNDLTTLIRKLKTERRFAALDEAATKQGIILPLLFKLGWDTFNIDEVAPEFSVGGRKVDYALRLKNFSKVFIEAKKPSEDLEKHQEQLLDYSFKQGVKLAVLTNGASWWFYLPLNEGSWEQRKFYTIDIVEQDPGDVAGKFVDLLAKENVESSNAIQNAEALYRGQQKTRIVKETLPLAWNKILSEGDELLIDLISETTEKLCGYKVDSDFVEAFLEQNRARLQIEAASNIPGTRSASRPAAPKSIFTPKGYTGMTIEGFSFAGHDRAVSSWIDLLLTICAELASQHGRDFDRVLTLAGRKRPYFSDNPDVLRVPREIQHSKLFVESNLSANSIVRLSFDLISLFGHSHSDLIIRTR